MLCLCEPRIVKRGWIDLKFLRKKGDCDDMLRIINIYFPLDSSAENIQTQHDRKIKLKENRMESVSESNIRTKSVF